MPLRQWKKVQEMLPYTYIKHNKPIKPTPKSGAVYGRRYASQEK